MQQLSGLTEEAGEWSQVRSGQGAAAERADRTGKSVITGHLMSGYVTSVMYAGRDE